jgi:CRP-like cAMP-binding protein
LLEERPRTATVTTVEPSTVWQIPGDVFLDALDDAGAAPSALLDAMADRLASHESADRSNHP